MLDSKTIDSIKKITGEEITCIDDENGKYYAWVGPYQDVFYEIDKEILSVVSSNKHALFQKGRTGGLGKNNCIITHKVRWSEDNSFFEKVFAFEGFGPDVEKQLTIKELNFLYRQRLYDIWETYVVSKAFERQQKEIERVRNELYREHEFDVYCPSMIDALQHMGLYRERHGGDFSLKIDGALRGYRFIEDLDAAVIDRQYTSTTTVIHRVQWTENGERTEKCIAFDGLSANAEEHIGGDLNDQLYTVYFWRVTEAWKKDIVLKAFENQREEIKRVQDELGKEYEKKNDEITGPSIIETLEYMGLYVKGSWDLEFSLKINDTWKSYRYVDDLSMDELVI